MPEEKFKLPSSSYEELSKIIKAYGHFSEPASLDEVSKFIGIHSTVISRNSGFLLEIEVLEPGSKKVLTQKGRELAQALEHEMPDEIRHWWRKIVIECEFIAKLVSAVKIRRGMDEATLISHIAYSAGQPKKPQYMTGARTIIDILRAAELIADQDGKFAITESVTTVVQRNTESEPSPLPADTRHGEPVVLPVVSRNSAGAMSPEININIEIKVSCEIGDLEALGAKLRKLMSELQEDKQQGAGSKPDTED